MLSVNDAIFMCAKEPDYIYRSGPGKNGGTAKVLLEACADSGTSPPCSF